MATIYAKPMVTLPGIYMYSVYDNNSVGYQSVGYSICFYMVTQSTTLALINHLIL